MTATGVRPRLVDIPSQLRAFDVWDRDSNMRDVLDRHDLHFLPEAVYAVLERRALHRCGPHPVVALPYPKDDGTYRQTCVLDPYDDLQYAAVVSALAPMIERALPGRGTVLNTRFVSFGSAFGAEGWRKAHRRRRIHRRNARLVLGGFDVQNQFGSTNVESFTSILNSCLAPTSLIEELTELLSDLAAWPGTPNGLLTGPMASALLGTVALLPVDRVLWRHGVRYQRWVDDVIGIFCDEDHFYAVVDAVNEQLALGRQRLNPEKTWFQEGGSHASSLEEEVDGPPERDVEPDLDRLRAACEAGDAKLCRYLLGGLRARADDQAAAFVASSDAVWRLAPKYSADYLIAVKHGLAEDDLVQLAERCSLPPTEETAAAIAHAGRVIAQRRVPSSLGQALYDAADRASTGHYRAVSPPLYRARSISKEKPRRRHERAIDTAAALNDLNSQRALIAGLRYDTRPRRVERGLTMLERAHPDLTPTIHWVRAAA
jgi:hypothetical protein